MSGTAEILWGQQGVCRALGGTLGAALLIEPDLEGDQLQALVERCDLGGHVLLVLAQQAEAVFLVARSLPDQVGVLADRDERHAGDAELDADFEPFEVPLGVDPASIGAAVNRGDEQALALIEPQRVNAQAGALGDLPDAQAQLRFRRASWPNVWRVRYGGCFRHAAQDTGLT